MFIDNFAPHSSSFSGSVVFFVCINCNCEDLIGKKQVFFVAVQGRAFCDVFPITVGEVKQL